MKLLAWLDRDHDGPTNMAIDEALAQYAVSNQTVCVRVYRWSVPTLSLGYFQSFSERLERPTLADLVYTRRLSGGGAIVHEHELTYSLALPDTGNSKAAAGKLYCDIHQSLIQVLADLGLEARQYRNCKNTALNRTNAKSIKATAKTPPAFLCFARRSDADLIVAGHKVVGSAQRRVHHALLQHGSVLLKKSPAAQELLGVCDLMGQIKLDFSLDDREDAKLNFDRSWTNNLAITIVKGIVAQVAALVSTDETNWIKSMAELGKEFERNVAQLTRDKFANLVWLERH